MSEANRTVDTKGAVLAFNQGVAAAAQGDERQAVELWTRALELDRSLLPAALNLVTYFQNRGDLQAEIELWDAIVEFDPFDTDNLVLQAAARRRAGHLDKARENYHRAIAIYPYFKFWYHELARLYEEMGEHDEAELWRGRGDSLGADEAEICYEDGLRHVSEERWQSARTCFEAVLDEFPANLDARLRLAKVLERAGTAEEVVDQYSAALDLTEAAKGLVHYRLGEFLVKQGTLDQAEQTFEVALSESPTYRKAERALAGVRHHRARQAATAANAVAAEAAPAESAPAEAAPAEAATSEPTVAEVAPADPAVAEPELVVLNPADIGMEPISAPLIEFFSPEVRAPNTRLPWAQQVRQFLDQALSVAAPGGREPRVAVVMERDIELAEAARGVLAELRSLGRSLRADATVSHIYVVQALDDESNGPVSAGWLGRDPQARVAASSWQRVRPWLPVNDVLRSVREAAGDQGFNCMVVVSFGRCNGVDEETLDLVAGTPIHALCHLRPGYHYIDLRAALSSRVRNFIEIEL